MSKIFSNYDELENVVLESVSKIESKDKKKIRKLKKTLKKQAGYIRELKRIESADKREPATEERETKKNETKKFFSRVADAFIKALPSILRCASKIIVTTVCERILSRSRKPQVS